MKKTILVLLFAVSFTAAWAQRDPAYVRVISERTDKNMSGLGITDPQAAERVKEVIMNHYFTLNDIHNERDSLRQVQKDHPESGITAESISSLVDSKLYRHHFAFISALMVDLDEEQIEGVKNALTYNVLNVTYEAHLDMIPSLTEAQKKQIYAWLYEARELAIDGGSSNEKHGIFGKYKGRINNYLSREGYNLTREREAWNERIKQRNAGTR